MLHVERLPPPLHHRIEHGFCRLTKMRSSPVNVTAGHAAFLISWPRLPRTKTKTEISRNKIWSTVFVELLISLCFRSRTSPKCRNHKGSLCAEVQYMPYMCRIYARRYDRDQRGPREKDQECHWAGKFIAVSAVHICDIQTLHARVWQVSLPKAVSMRQDGATPATNWSRVQV